MITYETKIMYSNNMHLWLIKINVWLWLVKEHTNNSIIGISNRKMQEGLYKSE